MKRSIPEPPGHADAADPRADKARRIVAQQQIISTRATTRSPPPYGFKYRKIEKLGQGTYGVVYKAVSLQGPDKGALVALKKVHLEDDNGGVPSGVIREVCTLKDLKHTNIVKLLDMISSKRDNSLYLVFELMDLNLKEYLDELRNAGSGLPYETAKDYLYQLLKGTHHCHMHRVLHRDMKPQNILLDKARVTIKLADFGLSRTFGFTMRPYSEEVVTVWYRAPELLLGQQTYSSSLDMWSISCIFAEMVTGDPLFPGDSEIDQLYKIFRVLGSPEPDEWEGFTKLPGYKATFATYPRRPLSTVIPELCELSLSLLKGLFAYEPLDRTTAAGALSHPFFNSLSQGKRGHRSAESNPL